MLLLSAVILFAGLEATLRFLAKRKMFGMGNPYLYAHPFCGDDYAKLNILWQNHSQEEELGKQGYVTDELYGWKKKEHAILGKNESGTIALAGDSFMSGVLPAPPEERIPYYLHSQLPDFEIHDLSGVGYGMDQIYMRILDFAASTDGSKKTLIWGLLLDDIDRVVEEFRDAQKPFFLNKEDGFTIHNVPIKQDIDSYLKKNPVKFKSILLARINRIIYSMKQNVGDDQDNCRRPEKEDIATTIVENIVNIAKAYDINIVFLLFYRQEYLQDEPVTWKELFIKNLITKYGMKYLDTRDIFRIYKDAPDKIYFPRPNGHLNSQGNFIVASAIKNFVKGNYAQSIGIEKKLDYKQFGRLKWNGWYQPEAGHVFMHGEKSHLFLRGEPNKNSRIKINLASANKIRNENRTLLIKVNNNYTKALPLNNLPNGWGEHILEIPLPSLVTKDNDLVLIRFELPYVTTPSEYQELPDDRSLGLALRSIELASD